MKREEEETEKIGRRRSYIMREERLGQCTMSHIRGIDSVLGMSEVEMGDRMMGLAGCFGRCFAGILEMRRGEARRRGDARCDAC